MKKLLVSLLAALVLCPLTSQVALAADSGMREIEQKEAGVINYQITNQPNKEAHGTDTVDGMWVDAYWSLVGGKPIVENTNNEGGQVDGVLNIVYSEGLIGSTGRVIAGMYGNPAATTERYVADVLNSAGVKVAQPAYAQGLGFASLDPILDTWKTFRNVAYLGFVIIFLVIGFLIMLRQQVGQTAVTAQQAIPQIIIALLMVTFSYAIAGLLIDLMYLLMYLILTLFVGTSQESWQPFIDHNFLTLGLKMIGAGFTTAYKAVNVFVENILSAGKFWQGLLKNVGGISLAVIIAAAIAFKIFELFLELLKTYVTIILNVVFAPIFLMLGAIPGKNPAKQWLTDMIGNLAAFPIVLMILIIFNELTGGIVGEGGITAEEGGFMPPYLLNSGAGFSGSMAMMVGLGMLVIMPELVKKAKEALGVKEGVFTQMAQDVGESLSKGFKGGELIPGLGVTDTTKLPVIGGYVGSPENMLRKLGIFGAGVGGGLKGAGEAMMRSKKLRTDEYTPRAQFVEQFRTTAGKVGSKWGDEQINEEQLNKNQENQDKQSS